MKDTIWKLMFNILKIYEDVPFLPERMRVLKFEKFVADLHDKTENVIYIRNLNQALYHGIGLKNVHRVVRFNEKALKLYV